MKAPLTFSYSSTVCNKQMVRWARNLIRFSLVIAPNALREDFPGQMFIFRHFSGITAPVVTGYHADIKLLEQRQKFTAGVIRARSERISQSITRISVASIPEPVLAGFTADKTPLLIEFTDNSHISMSDRRGCYSFRREFFKVRMTVLIPILSDLAVSRTLAPLKVISVICSLTPDLRVS